MVNQFKFREANRREVMSCAYGIGEGLRRKVGNLLMDMTIREKESGIWDFVIRIYVDSTDNMVDDQSKDIGKGLQFMASMVVENPLFEAKEKKFLAAKKMDTNGATKLAEGKEKNRVSKPYEGREKMFKFEWVGKTVSSHNIKSIDDLTMAIKGETLKFEAPKSLKISCPNTVKEHSFTIQVSSKVCVGLFGNLAGTLMINPNVPISGLQQLEAILKIGDSPSRLIFSGTNLLRKSQALIQALYEKELKVATSFLLTNRCGNPNCRDPHNCYLIHQVANDKDKKKTEQKEGQKKHKIDDEMMQLLRRMGEWSLKGDNIPTDMELTLKEQLSDGCNNSVFPIKTSQNADKTLQALLSLSEGSLRKTNLQMLVISKEKALKTFGLGSYPRAQMQRLVLGFLSMWVMQPELFTGVAGIRVTRVKSEFSVQIELLGELEEPLRSRLSLLPRLML